MVHNFSGTWITTAEMVSLKPNAVFHKQLDCETAKKFDLSVQNRHILFRRDFELADVPKNTRVFITADDYYKLYVNGNFVAQGPAAGYHFHYYYNVVDIGKYIKPGRNVIAVHTYYQGLINRVWVSGDNRHGLLLDVVADGHPVVSSDSSFRCTIHSAFSIAGKVGYDTQFMERYDARSNEVGFEKEDFDDSQWEHAVAHPLASDYHVVPQPSELLVFEKIKPASVEKIHNGLRIDFGGIYVGYLAYAATGIAGGEIKMYFGQELCDDGSVRHDMRCNCDYVEYMILSGNRDVLNEFDFKSFRYAEIILPDNAEVDVDSIVLEARHYPFVLRAKPNFTDKSLMPIWDLCVNTYKYGVQEQIQDCMDREKGYYLGDGCYTLFSHCILTQDFTLARKFIDDFLRTSFIDRGLVTCANCSFMQEIAEYPLIFIVFVKLYIDVTGDKDFIRDRFSALTDVLDCYREHYAREDGLLTNLDKWCVVEWPGNLRDGYDADVTEGKVCTAVHNAINAYYVGAVKTLNAIAREIGLPEYADATPLEKAFRKAFYNEKVHLFRDAVDSEHISMPGNIYAAFFELADDPDFHDAFVSMVRAKRFTAINFFTVFPLFETLRRDGEEKLMAELLADEGAWKRMIREGATRTFEGWGRDSKWNTSLFHLTLGCGVCFMCDWKGK